MWSLLPIQATGKIFIDPQLSPTNMYVNMYQLTKETANSSSYQHNIQCWYIPIWDHFNNGIPTRAHHVRDCGPVQTAQEKRAKIESPDPIVEREAGRAGEKHWPDELISMEFVHIRPYNQPYWPMSQFKASAHTGVTRHSGQTWPDSIQVGLNSICKLFHLANKKPYWTLNAPAMHTFKNLRTNLSLGPLLEITT